jgi:hypothetical protein
LESHFTSKGAKVLQFPTALCLGAGTILLPPDAMTIQAFLNLSTFHTQQWRSPSQALEVVWRGKSEKLLSLEALLKQRIEAIDQAKMLGSGKAFATR